MCDELYWKYDISKYTNRPPSICYTKALLNKSISYHRIIQCVEQMKNVLNSGFPFVFGFTVYESFESDQVQKTGIMPMPYKDETILGGHAVVCVGYFDAENKFLIRNSRGNDWGMNGYFTMPYKFIEDKNYCSDFWIIKS